MPKRRIIRVTATVTYEFDTDDGLVSTEAEAVEDVESMLLSGPSLDQFVIKAETI